MERRCVVMDFKPGVDMSKRTIGLSLSYSF